MAKTYYDLCRQIQTDSGNSREQAINELLRLEEEQREEDSE